MYCASAPCVRPPRAPSFRCPQPVLLSPRGPFLLLSPPSRPSAHPPLPPQSTLHHHLIVVHIHRQSIDIIVRSPRALTRGDHGHQRGRVAAGRRFVTFGERKSLPESSSCFVLVPVIDTHGYEQSSNAAYCLAYLLVDNNDGESFRKTADAPIDIAPTKRRCRRDPSHGEDSPPYHVSDCLRLSVPVSNAIMATFFAVERTYLQGVSTSIPTFYSALMIGSKDNLIIQPNTKIGLRGTARSHLLSLSLS